MKKKLFVCILFFNSLFGQDIGYNTEFLIDTYIDRNDKTDITYLVGGGFVVVWKGSELSGKPWNIYVQIYDKNKKKKGEQIQANTYTNNGRSSPTVCHLNNGGFVVVWVSEFQDGDGSGIYLQIFNKDGIKVGKEFQVNTYTKSNQESPSISGLDSGGFVVTWTSWNQDGESGSGVYAQLYDESGIQNGNEFQVNTNTNNWQYFSNVTDLANNGFVITWISGVQDNGWPGIYSQMFSEDGSKKGGEFQTNSNRINAACTPSVCSLNSENFVVVWVGRNHLEVYAQLLNKYGEKIGNVFLVNSNAKDHLNHPKVIKLNNGTFVVAWTCWAQASEDQFDKEVLSDVFAQIFYNNGNKVGREFQVNMSTNNSQRKPSIANIDNGFIIIWSSNHNSEFVNGGIDDGVFGNFYLNEPVKHNLNLITCLKPKLDVIINSTNPLFFWNRSTRVHKNFSWEISYDLFLDYDESFSNPMIISNLEDTTYQIDSLIPGKTYFWKVLTKNYLWDSLWSSNVNGFYVNDSATVGYIGTPFLSNKFELQQNYPNPFNPTTTIKYKTPYSSREISGDFVTLKIYDILGNDVETLVNKNQSHGNYMVNFNAKDLPSGIYFYRLKVGNFTETKKMILMR